MKIKLALLAIFASLAASFCCAYNPPSPAGAGAAGAKTNPFGFETEPKLNLFGGWVDVTNAGTAQGTGAWLPTGAAYVDPFSFPTEDDPNVGVQGG